MTDEGDLLVLDDLRIDVAGRLATRQGRVLDLSRTEFDLLEVLVGNAGVVLSRDQLYAMVWDGALETDSKTLDVYVGYLRKKLEVDGATRLLHTVRSMGYVAAPAALAMSLRLRITLVVVLVVTVVVAVVGQRVYAAAERELVEEVDIEHRAEQRGS